MGQDSSQPVPDYQKQKTIVIPSYNNTQDTIKVEVHFTVVGYSSSTLTDSNTLGANASFGFGSSTQIGANVSGTMGNQLVQTQIPFDSRKFVKSKKVFELARYTERWNYQINGGSAFFWLPKYE